MQGQSMNRCRWQWSGNVYKMSSDQNIKIAQSNVDTSTKTSLAGDGHQRLDRELLKRKKTLLAFINTSKNLERNKNCDVIFTFSVIYHFSRSTTPCSGFPILSVLQRKIQQYFTNYVAFRESNTSIYKITEPLRALSLVVRSRCLDESM